MRQQETNRLDVSSQALQGNIKKHIAYLDKSITNTKKRIRNHIDSDPDLKSKKALLESIPVVGGATINVVLSEFSGIAALKQQST